MIPAVLTIMIAGAPAAQIEGYVYPSTCTMRFPYAENSHHQRVVLGVTCAATPVAPLGGHARRGRR